MELIAWLDNELFHRSTIVLAIFAYVSLIYWFVDSIDRDGRTDD